MRVPCVVLLSVPNTCLCLLKFTRVCHVFVCVPRLELRPRWQCGPCLVLAPGFFVLGSCLLLGSGLAVPACAPVCKCLAFVPSPLDPLLLQVHRLPRWRMPRPCSVLLLCSGFRVVLGFGCGGFWVLFGFCWSVRACRWLPVPCAPPPSLRTLSPICLFVCPGSDFVFAARSSSAPSLGGQTLGPGAGTVPGSVGLCWGCVSGFVLGLC